MQKLLLAETTNIINSTTQQSISQVVSSIAGNGYYDYVDLDKNVQKLTLVISVNTDINSTYATGKYL